MDELNIVRMNSQQLSYRTKMALISIIRENGKDGKPFKLPNEDELATRLGVSRNVLRDALMSLEELGFVTRRRSKEDERVLLVNVTASGRALQEQALGVGCGAEDKLGLTPEECTTLHALLYKVLAAIGEE